MCSGRIRSRGHHRSRRGGQYSSWSCAPRRRGVCRWVCDRCGVAAGQHGPTAVIRRPMMVRRFLVCVSSGLLGFVAARLAWSHNFLAAGLFAVFAAVALLGLIRPPAKLKALARGLRLPSQAVQPAIVTIIAFVLAFSELTGIGLRQDVFRGVLA